MTTTIDPRPAPSYALASYEVDLMRRTVAIRYAPLLAGKPDPSSSLVEYEVLVDEVMPPAPGDPPEPTKLATDDPGYQAAVEAWLTAKKAHEAKADAYLVAQQAQDFTAWLADPRPDHAKARDFFTRARARHAA